MAKRKSVYKKNTEVVESAMTRMIQNLRDNKPTEISPRETALILQVMAYSLRKMTEDLRGSTENVETK